VTTDELLRIRVTITDRDAIGAIPYEKAEAYLLAHGWRHAHDWKPSGWMFIWDKKGSDFQLRLAPKEFADFTLRLMDTLHVLGKHEGRSELLIYREIMEQLPVSVTVEPMEG
jgi:hypothetical protein